MINQQKQSLMRLIPLLSLIMFGLISVSASADVTFEKSIVILETKNGQHEIAVEMAVSREQRARGLMFRKSLAPDSGMLFDYGYPQEAAMWMKNTYLPLDMFFIKENGVIEKIESRTTPKSLRTIYSKGKIRAVLELSGGSAERIGIHVGDIVRHAIFGNTN